MWQLVRLAFRSLLRNRRRSALTFGAVALGVTVVVFAQGFGEGLLRMMVLNNVDTRLGALQVHKKGYLDASEAQPLKLDMALDDSKVQALLKLPHITGVTPRIRFGALLGNGVTSSMVLGEAIDPVLEYTVCPKRKSAVPEGSGHGVDVNAPHGVVLGPSLATALHAKPGGSLTVQAAAREGGLNALDVDVQGITRGAASLLEAKRVLEVPLGFAQDLLQMQGRVTEFAIAVDDLESLPSVRADVQRVLGDDVEVSSWDEVMPFLRDAVTRLHVVLRGISLVLFLIVVFGVVNSMLMNVYERVREIGTMMAVGVRRSQILTLFLLEALFVGVAGGVVGSMLGLALTQLMNRIGISLTPPGGVFPQIIHPVPQLSVAAIAMAAAVLGAVVAAAYPARKASLMNPVEALRTL